MKTHKYYKDGQERVVTGTDEEIAAEIAGTPWLPPAPPAPAVEEAPPPPPAAPPSGSETDPGPTMAVPTTEAPVAPVVEEIPVMVVDSIAPITGDVAPADE